MLLWVNFFLIATSKVWKYQDEGAIEEHTVHMWLLLEVHRTRSTKIKERRELCVWPKNCPRQLCKHTCIYCQIEVVASKDGVIDTCQYEQL